MTKACRANPIITDGLSSIIGDQFEEFEQSELPSG